MIDPQAVVEPGVVVGARTQVWRWSLLRAGTRVGEDCRIGSHVVIGPEVSVGNGCKIEDGAKVYGPASLGYYVFIGPGVVITNDRSPSAFTRNWKPPAGQKTRIGHGASVGANAVIQAGVWIGRGAVIGAGAVVLQDVPEAEVWAGVPAKRVGVKEYLVKDPGTFQEREVVCLR